MISSNKKHLNKQKVQFRLQIIEVKIHFALYLLSTKLTDIDILEQHLAWPFNVRRFFQTFNRNLHDSTKWKHKNFIDVQAINSQIELGQPKYPKNRNGNAGIAIQKSLYGNDIHQGCHQCTPIEHLAVTYVRNDPGRDSNQLTPSGIIVPPEFQRLTTTSTADLHKRAKRRKNRDRNGPSSILPNKGSRHCMLISESRVTIPVFSVEDRLTVCHRGRTPPTVRAASATSRGFTAKPHYHRSRSARWTCGCRGGIYARRRKFVVATTGREGLSVEIRSE